MFYFYLFCISLATKDDKYFPTFFLAIETGMRPKEYLGLQWKDVDFEQKVLSVRRALMVRKGDGFIFTEPKTSRSRHSIPISTSLINALKTYKREQLEDRMKIASDYQNFDLVFPFEIGTPLLHGNLRHRHFNPLLKKENLPNVRLDDLRHTTATLLLSAGENPKVVAERSGRASIVLTLDTYNDVLPSMQKDATDKLRMNFENS